MRRPQPPSVTAADHSLPSVRPPGSSGGVGGLTSVATPSTDATANNGGGGADNAGTGTGLGLDRSAFPQYATFPQPPGSSAGILRPPGSSHGLNPPPSAGATPTTATNLWGYSVPSPPPPGTANSTTSQHHHLAAANGLAPGNRTHDPRLVAAAAAAGIVMPPPHPNAEYPGYNLSNT